MTGYFLAFVIGGAAYVLTRLAMWRLVHRADDIGTGRTIGVVASLLFIWPISGVVAFVGLIGMQHEANAGQPPPVPMPILWALVGVGLVINVVQQQRRRVRVLRAVRRMRAQRRQANAAERDDS